MDLIKKKNERLLSVPNAFEDAVSKAQKELFNEIIALVDSLERDGGNIVISSDNLLKIEEIGIKIKQALNGSDYIEAVREFASEFDKQAEINIEYFKNTFPDFKESELASQILANSKKITVELLVSTENEFILPLKDVLNDAVVSGSSWGDTVKNIRTFVEGNKDLDGRLLRYSKQIASDALATSDRAFTMAVSEDLGAEWFFYSGGEIGGTREFCHERNGRYFHKKEVEKWSHLDWPGKNKQTNERTIFILAGGYNCKHSIMPVSLYAVPISDIQRNIQNGNFIPSDFEKRELKLK